MRGSSGLLPVCRHLGVSRDRSRSCPLRIDVVALLLPSRDGSCFVLDLPSRSSGSGWRGRRGSRWPWLAPDLKGKAFVLPSPSATCSLQMTPALIWCVFPCSRVLDFVKCFFCIDCVGYDHRRGFRAPLYECGACPRQGFASAGPVLRESPSLLFLISDIVVLT